MQQSRGSASPSSAKVGREALGVCGMEPGSGAASTGLIVR